MENDLFFSSSLDEPVLGRADYQFISIFAGSERIGGGHVACAVSQTELYFPLARIERVEGGGGLIIRFPARKGGDDDAS